MMNLAATLKEKIITDMCLTWRHDFFLRVSETEKETHPLSSGITHREADFLYNRMKQLYENCIEPYITTDKE